MSREFFDYELPTHLIAQEPAAQRDAARLLVVERKSSKLSHRQFRELPDLLAPGDLLVLNDTRVLHARLVGRRARTGGRWEGLFLRAHEGGAWELLCQTRGRLCEGETIHVEPGPLQLTLVKQTPERHWLAEPVLPVLDSPISLATLLEQFGQVPLPPYVRKGHAHASDR